MRLTRQGNLLRNLALHTDRDQKLYGPDQEIQDIPGNPSAITVWWRNHLLTEKYAIL